MAQQVTATILKVGTGPLFITPQNWSFPTQEIAIEEVHSGSINSSILFSSMLFYASESFSSLVAAANAGGGSGGNTIYTADDSLVSDRTVDLNGHTLQFSQGANSFLDIQPITDNESITVKSYNNSGGGSRAKFTGQTTPTGSSILLDAVFDDGTNEISISGLADGVNSLVVITANNIQLNGDISVTGNANFSSGANGTFTSQDGKTITVTAGIITSIV